MKESIGSAASFSNEPCAMNTLALRLVFLSVDSKDPNAVLSSERRGTSFFIDGLPII